MYTKLEEFGYTDKTELTILDSRSQLVKAKVITLAFIMGDLYYSILN